MKTNDLLEAALEYSRRGKCVFPCGMDKKPLVKGGFKTASQDMAQIREWWRRWPKAMIGMPTGHVNGFLAIDCDGEAGVNNFIAICQENSFTPDTVWQSTPGGGRHYLFYMPENDIRCSAGQLANAVDIRATGGYIICAPSRREDGKCYEWKANVNLSPLPEPLLNRLLNLRKEKVISRPVSASMPEGYIRRAVDGEIARIKSARVGELNTILNAAAFALGQFVGANMLDEAYVEDELRIAAESCGLSLREAAKTIESGLRAGTLEPRQSPTKPIQTKTETATKTEAKTEWPEPVHFAMFNLPKMSENMLPPVIGEYCVALSEEKQTPLELAVCMSLVTLATAAQSGFRIKSGKIIANP